MTRLGSLVSVKSSPPAVITFTPRATSSTIPRSWAMRSRAKRLACSISTTRTPLPSILSSNRAKPGCRNRQLEAVDCPAPFYLYACYYSPATVSAPSRVARKSFRRSRKQPAQSSGPSAVT